MPPQMGDMMPGGAAGQMQGMMQQGMGNMQGGMQGGMSPDMGGMYGGGGGMQKGAGARRAAQQRKRTATKKPEKKPVLPRTTLRTSSCTRVLNMIGRMPSWAPTKSILRTASIALSTVAINGTVT